MKEFYKELYWDGYNYHLNEIDGPVIKHLDGLSKIHFGNRICYFLNNKYHRLDGPAIETIADDNYPYVKHLYWINGNMINVSSYEEFQKYVKLVAFL